MEVKNILKVMGVLLTTASIPLSASAQFDEGDNVLGVGIGVLGGYGIGFTGNGVTQSPAIEAHFDHGMGDLEPGTWGLGGYLGYKTSVYKYNYNYFGYANNYDYHYTFLVIGARGTWHYNEWHGMDNLDTYGGVMLAYKSITYKDKSDYSNNPYYVNTYSFSGSGVDIGAFLGARYYFSDKIGAFGEIGYGITWIQLGLAVKL